jgi:hypothetical protein
MAKTIPRHRAPLGARRTVGVDPCEKKSAARKKKQRRKPAASSRKKRFALYRATSAVRECRERIPSQGVPNEGRVRERRLRGDLELTDPRKRFCSDRCRRIVANRRYRARRTETAICPCGRTFERAARTKRLKVYCSLECQYEARSAEYQERPDIKANLNRGRRTVIFS